jgi:hypothetical protein
MAEHPYTNAQPYQRWRQAVGRTPPDSVDPVVRTKFRIARQDRIATAGSCFAQHIARRLRDSGFDFLVTETAHPLLPAPLAESFGYGIYTARFGNIYTARQLLQLWQRATGNLQPRDACWEQGGRFFDPFRPAIQPDGFATRREFELDRDRHFAAVVQAFETMDVLVFTLGLTECWADSTDGCVYPVCPGTVAGVFDPGRHEFLNFSVQDVADDLRAFVAAVRMRNPDFRMILTVSPVPLAATALDQHVLVSTTYSKSVLRVAAEMAAADPRIQYFPSYEVITGPFSRGRYYADDLRAVTEAGVDHVMRLFLAHATEGGGEPHAPPAAAHDDHFARLSQAVGVLCEEEALDPGD